MKKIMSAVELLSQPQKELEYLWRPFIVKRTLSVLSGSSDVGKSSFLRQLAIAITTGCKDFLGMELNPVYNSVLYLSTEDNEFSMPSLITRQMTDHDCPDKPEGLKFLFDSEEPLRDIEAEIKAHNYDAVIIDSLGDAFEGNINEMGDVRRFLKKLQTICNMYDCTPIFLHHIGKKAENLEANKTNMVGSHAIEAKARLVLQLQKGNSSTRRNLTVTKANYLPESYKNKALVLEFDDLQKFTVTGESAKPRLATGSKRFPNKEVMLEKVAEYMSSGVNEAKAIEQVRKTFPNPPSATTLKNWRKEASKGLFLDQGNEDHEGSLPVEQN